MYCEVEKQSDLNFQVNGQLIVGELCAFGHSTHKGIAMWVLGQAFEFKWDIPRWDVVGSSSAQHDAQVVAPMPGTVVKVRIKHGYERERCFHYIIRSWMQLAGIVLHKIFLCIVRV